MSGIAHGSRVTHKVVWLERADLDLDAIYQWVADRSDPETALGFVLQIEEAAERLADFPNRGSPRNAIKEGLRSIPHARSVSIFYTVQLDQVRIVRVIHARRDLNAAFEETE